MVQAAGWCQTAALQPVSVRSGDDAVVELLPLKYANPALIAALFGGQVIDPNAFRVGYRRPTSLAYGRSSYGYGGYGYQQPRRIGGYSGYGSGPGYGYSYDVGPRGYYGYGAAGYVSPYAGR